MAMSKKDYQALARAIFKATNEDAPTSAGTHAGANVLGYIISRIGDVLAADNPRFDRARFVEACETGGCKGMPKR